ncbi:hypothetical protein EWM64_g7709 [Hericium alpestre]|uniref:Uncharacterized protein n=1 Tax=Hericium alpestre TaxID=135208 RepID=A0A4Y9ZPW7_9AGAM|nr:hypothetical protein EWM64_g7709 [Hericium alpestre]
MSNNIKSIVTTEYKFREGLTGQAVYASRRSYWESAIYALATYILAKYGSNCVTEDATIGCHPQGTLDAMLTTRSDIQVSKIQQLERRSADFSVLRFPNRRVVYGYVRPSVRKPEMIFWWEVKPFNLDWWNPASSVRSMVKYRKHMAQLNEQAVSVFQNYSGNTYWAILSIGPYFSLFKYTRPPSANQEITDASSLGHFTVSGAALAAPSVTLAGLSNILISPPTSRRDVGPFAPNPKKRKLIVEGEVKAVPAALALVPAPAPPEEETSLPQP